MPDIMPNPSFKSSFFPYIFVPVLIRTQQMLAPIHSASNQTIWFTKNSSGCIFCMQSHLQVAAACRRSASAACTAPSCSGSPAHVPPEPSDCDQSPAHGRRYILSCRERTQHMSFSHEFVLINRYSGKIINSCKIKYNYQLTKRYWSATYLNYTTLIYSKMLTGIKVTISPDLWNAAKNMSDSFVVVWLLSSL